MYLFFLSHIIYYILKFYFSSYFCLFLSFYYKFYCTSMFLFSKPWFACILIEKVKDYYEGERRTYKLVVGLVEKKFIG